MTRWHNKKDEKHNKPNTPIRIGESKLPPSNPSQSLLFYCLTPLPTTHLSWHSLYSNLQFIQALFPLSTFVFPSFTVALLQGPQEMVR